MKTRSLWLLGLLALVLVFAGCSGGGGETYTISLPDPSSLDSYDVSSSEGVPQNSTEAKSSASTVDTAVSTEMSNIQGLLSSSIDAAATQTQNINQTYSPTNGGTITVTGTSTLTAPDSGQNGNYSARLQYTADLNSVVVDAVGSDPDYTTLDGQAAANYVVNLTYNENSDGSGSMTIGVTGQFGWALSVSSDETGVNSGKYILLVNMSGSGTVSWDQSGNYDASQAASSVSISGSLRVYDNNDNLVQETALTAADLDSDDGAFSIF